MPDTPIPKSRLHPVHAARAGEPRSSARSDSSDNSTPAYAELHVTSNFTFLTGASHPDELVESAAALGHRAIAITDTNTLGGLVRAHVAAKDARVQFVVGCRLDFTDPDVPNADASAAEASLPSVLVYPTDRPSYARLCTLLTLGKRRAEKGECSLQLHDLFEHAQGLLAVAVPPRILSNQAVDAIAGLRRVFDDDRFSIAASRSYAQHDDDRLHQIVDLCRHVRAPMLATNDVLYHTPARRPLQDVLTCIRHGCTIEQAGFRLAANAERHLKTPAEMARLFAAYPAAIARTLEIARRTEGFSLDQLRYDYPQEVVPDGQTARAHLAALTWAGAAERYPQGVPDKVRAQILHELRLIGELRYEPYFLTVHDLVRFARSKDILCQGRGAAANSAVCYALGVTAVDPDRVNVLFERFVSKERDEPPDIDIDFEHERREEVIQYIYAKYSRERAALTAEIISYRGRSAIRDVGKAMGLSLDCVDRLAKDMDWSDQPEGQAQRVREMGLDPAEPHLARVIALAREISGFPRHRSQHVGGFVITNSLLHELVPIENAAMPDRTVIEWDKDDIEALGMLKVDCLGLGMLTCIRKAIDLVNSSAPLTATPGSPPAPPLTFATIPPEDPLVYDMICKADTVGVFQIESRAQMSMLPRLKPRCYYDLVIEVAIVRPGPIQGDMVHPYLRRRSGEEPITYASPDIERVLGRTMGVPLFQEQAMSLAVIAAGFTPGEADQLRRAIASWKRSGKAILKFEKKLVEGMVARGYTRLFADQVFRQISGFSGYGFPESHAASFALLVYSSAWLKRHRPAAFAAALINSQPMGFYQPAQIVRDAIEHGVEVRPVDANLSQWDCTLEPTSAASSVNMNGPALRLGLRMVRSLSEADGQLIAAAAARAGPFESPLKLWRASGASTASLRALARADAFGSMNLPRRQALWRMQALKNADAPAPLFDGLDATLATPADSAPLPIPAPRSDVAADYRAVGLSLKAHPVSFLRDRLDALGVTRNAALANPIESPARKRVTVAGVVLVRQRPGTASGIVFMTIEDESGVANLIVRPTIYQRYRRVARHADIVLCTGAVERQGEVVHVMAQSFRNADETTDASWGKVRNFH